MKRRGNAVLALVLGVVVLAAFTLAWAKTEMPDKPIKIDSTNVFKNKKNEAVVFPHAKHKQYKCVQCHHNMKDGKNIWKKGDEVKECQACHGLKKKGKTKKLEKAFHDQCKKCHTDLKKKAKEDKTVKFGPTACKKCHAKKKK